MPKVAIVIVNYKDYARRFLKDCRDSLYRQTLAQENWQVYLVDNASTEETRKYLQVEFPEAKIIPRADGNYAAANNAGLKQALSDGCEYFVIANLDTIFSANWLQELVKAAQADQRFGLVQSKILLSGQNNWHLNSLGNINNFLGFGYTSHHGEPDRHIVGFPEIGYASGCSFLIKKEVLEKIGFYDEEYYMYHDDLELSWRAKLAGYKIVLAPESFLWHKYEFQRSLKMVYYMERNRYLTILSFYRLGTLILIFPPLLLMSFGLAIYSILGGWLKEYNNVWAYFCKKRTWSLIIAKRRQIKEFRCLSDREIIKDFSGRIDFQEVNNPILRFIVNPLFDLYWRLIKKIIIW